MTLNFFLFFFGYSITDEDELLFEICYDDDRTSAIYTTHIVNLANKSMRCFPLCGSIIFTCFIFGILALERSSHLSFKAPYTLYGEKIDEKYNTAKQTHRFFEIFGDGVTNEDLRELNYFSRNHLTPHADFPLASEQALTYYFQNCVPGKPLWRVFSEKFRNFVKLNCVISITGKQSMNQGVRNSLHFFFVF